MAYSPRRNYIAFDLEIAREVPDGGDWSRYRPFGITCAATVASNGASRLWHGVAADGTIADQMSRDEVVQLVKFLEAEAASGKTILTWNGAGFDFDVLAEESCLGDVCARLAYHHVDMMFHIFCLKGFALGLDKVAKGMGLPGKVEGMSGAKAPLFWRQGRRKEVLDYVLQDVVTTLQVCHEVEKNRAVRWTSNNGNQQFQPLPEGWLTVAQAMCLPLPDTSWMRDPWSRSKFTGWMSRHLG